MGEGEGECVWGCGCVCGGVIVWVGGCGCDCVGGEGSVLL